MNIKNKNTVLLNEDSRPSQKDGLFSFLEEFPVNATSWKDATDNIVDMGEWLLEELDGKYTPKFDVMTRSKTPAERNARWTTLIKDTIDLLTSEQAKRFYKRFGDWFAEKYLFESEQVTNEPNNQLVDFVGNKSKHFVFDSGLYMLPINAEMDIPGKLHLKWHADNTDNVEDFVVSVSNFVGIADKTLTEADMAKLITHYERYAVK